MNVCVRPLFIAAIVVICVGAVSTTRADDPNALRDGMGLLTASWDSATRCITAYNPGARADLPEGTALTTIKVSGGVGVVDFNDLIAVATTHATALWALDGDGKAVLFDPNAVVRPSGNAWVLGDRPRTFCVELPLDLDQPYVASLSELAFTVDALYGDPFVTIDVPIEASEEWIELAPRYRIQITDVTHADDTCRFTVKEEILEVYSHVSWPFDPNEDHWDETATASDVSRKVADFDVIDHVRILDTEGTPVLPGGLVRSWRLSGGMVTGTRTFTLYECASTEDLRIRYTIAMAPYEVPILLTLTDIPIPGL